MDSVPVKTIQIMNKSLFRKMFHVTFHDHVGFRFRNFGFSHCGDDTVITDVINKYRSRSIFVRNIC